MRDVRVAAVQFESVPGDKEANFRKIEPVHGRGGRTGCAPGRLPGVLHHRLLVHPQSVRGPTRGARRAGAGRARARSGCSTLAQQHRPHDRRGLVEAAGDGVFHNSYVVALPDGTVHAASQAARLRAPGDSQRRRSSPCSISPDGFRVGVLICYDCNLIENVRITALRGAEILIAPHQTGARAQQESAPHGADRPRGSGTNRHADPEAIETRISRRQRAAAGSCAGCPSRAHDNGLFLIFSNGVGVDDDEIRTGNAMILDPYGRILAETCEGRRRHGHRRPRRHAAREGHRPASGSAPAALSSTHRSRIPTGLECDTRTLKFEE